MKRKIIIILLCATSLCACKEIQTEREKRIETELHQQQESKNRWVAFAFILGIGCVAVLFIGAAMGAKARKDAITRE